DEQAFRGLKEERVGGDDAIRPAFPDGPQDLSPDGWPVYRTHQRLIGLRRRHPWLVDARTVVEHVTNTSMALRSRGAAADGDEVVYASTERMRAAVEAAGATFHAVELPALHGRSGSDGADDPHRTGLLPLRMILQGREAMGPLLAGVRAERPDVLVYSSLFL